MLVRTLTSSATAFLISHGCATIMSDGFLGYRTSFMLDLVACALIVVVPLLLYSLFVVKYRRQFVKHRNLQVTLGAILMVTVFSFEIDLQWVQGGWENVVAKREITTEQIATARTMLHVHLLFAISTPFLWCATLIYAFKRFNSPPRPGKHSRLHKTLGWLSTIDITLTSVTGLMFYYLAFVKPLL